MPAAAKPSAVTSAAISLVKWKISTRATATVITTLRAVSSKRRRPPSVTYRATAMRHSRPPTKMTARATTTPRRSRANPWSACHDSRSITSFQPLRSLAYRRASAASSRSGSTTATRSFRRSSRSRNSRWLSLSDVPESVGSFASAPSRVRIGRSPALAALASSSTRRTSSLVAVSMSSRRLRLRCNASRRCTIAHAPDPGPTADATGWPAAGERSSGTASWSASIWCSRLSSAPERDESSARS